jgi:hypothetical protein
MAHVFYDFATKPVAPTTCMLSRDADLAPQVTPTRGTRSSVSRDDVLQVLNSLPSRQASSDRTLHGGGELSLSTLGAQRSDRFVYMDAARDPTRDYSALGKKYGGLRRETSHVF